MLAYPPNNALFGSSYHSSPLQLGLWAYNAFVKSETKLGKWMFKSFATTPVLITSVSPDMRAKVAQNTLRNYGFFSGKVNYEIRPEKNPKKAKVAYAVQVGPLSLLDSITYLSFPPAQDSLLQATHNKRLLRSGDAFSAVRLTDDKRASANSFAMRAITIGRTTTRPFRPTHWRAANSYNYTCSPRRRLTREHFGHGKLAKRTSP